MKRRYTVEPRPATLNEIEARPKVGNVTFDLNARNEDGEVLIGENWHILVAARPIPGTAMWTDADTFPMFWCAIDPDSDFGPGHLERCEKLDASEMVFVTEEYIRETVQEYYNTEWPGEGVDVSEYELSDLWVSFVRIMEGEYDDHAV